MTHFSDLQLAETSETSERRLLAAILVAIASLTVIDISVDWFQRVGSLHLFIEAIVIPLTGYGLYLVWKDIVRAHSTNRLLKNDLAKVTAAAARWKEESSKHLHGLSVAIDAQLGRWELTPAEKEIAVLILKGLSNKEIAEVRQTSERTVRQQTLAIYNKSGLNSRAQLAAFFLEDLWVSQN